MDVTPNHKNQNRKQAPDVTDLYWIHPYIDTTNVILSLDTQWVVKSHGTLKVPVYGTDIQIPIHGLFERRKPFHATQYGAATARLDRSVK